MIALSPSVVLGTGLLCGGFLLGYNVKDNMAERKEAKAVAAYQKAYDDKANAYLQLSEAYENLRAKQTSEDKRIVQEVERIVERPVYRNVCIDDDGVRAVNEALTGRTSTPGKPAR